MVYDDEYLYASGWFYYQNPADIRAVGKKKDYLSFSPDWFGITIDTFDDKENGLIFGVNPNGARNDGTIKNDLLNDTDVNFSWNAFWDAKTETTESGWTAEIRVPFFQPAVPDRAGKNPDGYHHLEISCCKRGGINLACCFSGFYLSLLETITLQIG